MGGTGHGVFASAIAGNDASVTDDVGGSNDADDQILGIVGLFEGDVETIVSRLTDRRAGRRGGVPVIGMYLFEV